MTTQGSQGAEQDTLEELFNEAETLMQNLDTGDGVEVVDESEGVGDNAFSIDSDDEEEAVKEHGNKKVEIDDHPLSDEWLSAPDPQTTTTAPTNGDIPPVSGGGSTPTASTAATMDAFKQQTSRFASNLASMAQRAAREVAAATNPAVPVGAPVQPYPGTPHRSSTQQTPMSNGVNQTNVSDGPESVDEQMQNQLIKEHFGDLMPGEKVEMFLSNLLHVGDTSGVSFAASQSSGSIMWCFLLTRYRIILFSTASEEQLEVPAPAGWSPLCWPESTNSKKVLEMTLGSVDRIDKGVYQAAGSSYMGLVICSKDCGRVIRFTTSSYPQTETAFSTLNSFAFPGRKNLGYFFAILSKKEKVIASLKVDERTGQQIITLPPVAKRFDPMNEFPRIFAKTSLSQSPWIMWASLNSSYQLSPTYPSVLAGPATLDETNPDAQHIIRQCAAFRSERRMPSLTWCTTGGASIWRCAQPKVGLQGNRSPGDELFLRHIAESARGANAMAEPAPIYPRSSIQQLTGDYSKDWVPEPGCGLKILDLRPRSAAMANRTAGYGYENTSNYLNTTLQFCNIGNIHAVRDSYQKLCLVCNSVSTADVNWNMLIEETKWLSHIRLILAATWETAYWVHVWRMPVLLHCSHGWDRTSQVAALAQILLDPYYRTRHGFSVLVEKEFMSFGHPFHTRSAHGEGRSDKLSPQFTSTDEGQIAPIFLQFVDCVYQIVQLYPECFEFNKEYLLELSFNIYSNRFGTLLCDTEREREAAFLRHHTYSLWDYLDANAKFQNQNYVESDGVLLMPLPMLLRNVKLWSERHCFYASKPSYRPEGIN